MKEYDTIVIGAGIGGLSCGLELVNRGFRVLILEKSSQLGGRCSSLTINRCRVDLGTLLFPGMLFNRLKRYGINIRHKKVKALMRLGNNTITYPFGFSTLKELKSSGVSNFEIISLLFNYITRWGGANFDGSYLDFVYQITSNKILRNIWLAFNAVNCIPASTLSTSNVFGIFHKLDYFDVYYPTNGVISIPDSISNTFRENGGELKVNNSVERIIIKNDQVCGVCTDKENYRSNIVISNVGIKSTVSDLIGDKYFDKEYINYIRQLKPTLPVTSILIGLKKRPPFPKNIHFIDKVPEDLEYAFRLAKKGKFNEDAGYIINFPSVVNPRSCPRNTHCGTIQFVGDIPKKRIPELLELVEETSFKGLRESLIWHKTMTSADYEKLINCPSYVYKTAPILGQDRPDFILPIKGLFCVGDSVKPDYPSVMQALDSGFECAGFINRNLKKKTWIS